MKQQTIQDLISEHNSIEGAQASPYLTYLERFYFQKPAGFRGKIQMAQWIPSDTRRHMIEHVSAMLVAASRGRKKTRRMAFADFVRNSSIPRAETSRFTFERKANGQLVKRSKATGRFSKFSKRELEVIRKR